MFLEVVINALVSLLVTGREDLTGQLEGGEACFHTLFKECSSSLPTLMETYGEISSHLQGLGNGKKNGPQVVSCYSLQGSPLVPTAASSHISETLTTS